MGVTTGEMRISIHAPHEGSDHALVSESHQYR